MQTWHLLLFSILWLFLLSPTLAQTSNHESGQSENYPSKELLEFLADFGEIDDATFELIEFHALQDSASAQQENSDEN